MELPPTAACFLFPSHLLDATLPIIITVESSTTNISFTITADSIITTAGEWSPVLPNLSRGLSLPNRISLPTIIDITTNAITIRVHVNTAGRTSYDLIPTTTPIPNNNNNNNNNVLPITGLPLHLALCLANGNSNTGIAFGIRISPTFDISIYPQPVESQFGYAAFLGTN